MNPKSASMARTGEVSEIRIFGWERDDFHDWVFCENQSAYSFDVAMRYVTAVEIIDTFDHTYEL